MSLHFKDKILLLGGVGDTLDATHFQRAIDTSLTFEQTDVADEYEQQFFGANPNIPTGEHISLSYKTHLFTSGVAGTAPVYANALLACGFTEVIEAGVRVRYVLTASNYSKSKIQMNINRTLHEFSDCIGTVDLVFEKGLPMWQWQFKGIYNAPVNDASALPSPNHAPWLTYMPTGAGRTQALSFHGENLKAYSFSAAVGYEVIYDESLSTEEILYNGRSASAKTQIDAPFVDDFDLFAIASNATPGALSLTHGTVVGDIFKVEAPKAELSKKPGYVKLDNGHTGHDLELVLLPDLGNDEIEFIFE